jgi:hypothetical protein
MLHHVAQKGQNDCVIATAAWVANVSYEEAAARSPVPVGSRGLRWNESCYLLESLTGTPWNPSPSWWRRVSRLKTSDELCILITRKPWHLRTFHCIALEGKWVYDPAFAHPFTRREYLWKHWRVSLMFFPDSPEKLVDVRKNRLWEEFRAGLRSSTVWEYPGR